MDIYIDAKQHRLVMDRTKSGLVAFGERAVPHDIETAYDKQVYGGAKGKTFRKANSVNYVNDFALGTWAPLDLCEGKTYHFDVFVDKCSVEIFVDGGRIAMTNLVFPTVPYTSVQFYSKKGENDREQRSPLSAPTHRAHCRTLTSWARTAATRR